MLSPPAWCSYAGPWYDDAAGDEVTVSFAETGRNRRVTLWTGLVEGTNSLGPAAALAPRFETRAVHPSGLKPRRPRPSHCSRMPCFAGFEQLCGGNSGWRASAPQGGKPNDMPKVILLQTWPWLLLCGVIPLCIVGIALQAQRCHSHLLLSPLSSSLLYGLCRDPPHCPTINIIDNGPPRQRGEEFTVHYHHRQLCLTIPSQRTRKSWPSCDPCILLTLNQASHLGLLRRVYERQEARKVARQSGMIIHNDTFSGETVQVKLKPSKPAAPLKPADSVLSHTETQNSVRPNLVGDHGKK